MTNFSSLCLLAGLPLQRRCGTFSACRKCFSYPLPLQDFLCAIPEKYCAPISSKRNETQTAKMCRIYPIPRGLRTGVVYKFLCAGCSACYVGETTRHFSTRVREHISSDRNSHIFKHLQNSEHCRTLCSNDCFSILDHASTTFQLKIKEAIHILWEKPTLNHQLFHVNLKLSL